MPKLKTVAHLKIRDQPSQFVSSNNRYAVIQPDDTINYLKPNQIKANDRIIIQKDLAKSTKRELIRRLVRTELRADISVLQDWVDELQNSVMEEQLHTFYTQYCDSLSSYVPHSTPIVYSTLRNWYEGAVIFPLKYGHLRIIADLLENGRLRSIVDDPKTHILKRDIIGKIHHITHKLLSNPAKTFLNPTSSSPQKVQQHAPIYGNQISSTKTPKRNLVEFEDTLAKTIPDEWINRHWFIGMVEKIEFLPIQQIRIRKHRHRKHDSISAGYYFEEIPIIEFENQLLRWEHRTHVHVKSLEIISRNVLAPETADEFQHIRGHDIIAYLNRKVMGSVENYNLYDYWIMHLIEFIDIPPPKVDAKIYAHIAAFFASVHLNLSPAIFLYYVLCAPPNDALIRPLLKFYRLTDNHDKDAARFAEYENALQPYSLKLFTVPFLTTNKGITDKNRKTIHRISSLTLEGIDTKETYSFSDYETLIETLYELLHMFIEYQETKNPQKKMDAITGKFIIDEDYIAHQAKVVITKHFPPNKAHLLNALTNPKEIAHVLEFFRRARIQFLEFTFQPQWVKDTENISESSLKHQSSRKWRRKAYRKKHGKVRYVLLPRGSVDGLVYTPPMRKTVQLWWSHCMFNAELFYNLVEKIPDDLYIQIGQSLKTHEIDRQQFVQGQRLKQMSPCVGCIFNDLDWHSGCFLHHNDVSKCNECIPLWLRNQIIVDVPFLKTLTAREAVSLLGHQFLFIIRKNYTEARIQSENSVKLN